MHRESQEASKAGNGPLASALRREAGGECVVVSDVEDAYELSPTQEGMLFHGLDDGSSGVDLEQVVGTLEEALHETAFREAWERVIARHAILRTAFRWDGLTAPRQEVHRHVTVAWERLDWRDVSVEERAGRREALLAADRRLPFDLARTPLMRFALVAEGEALWTFLWSFHHALLDGRAFPLVLREVFAAYEALRTGEAWEPPAPRSYRDYIVWLRGRDVAAAEEYWTSTLEGFRAPTPVGVSRGPGAAEDGMGACEVRLSEVRTRALREFARTHDLTLNTLLQGAWALLLHRYTGEEDIVFGSTRACRRSALGGADDLVGLLINTLPIRVRVEPRAALVLWLRQLREIQIALRPHEHTPLVKVKGWSQVPRGRPLFESLVVFDNETLEAGLRSLGGAWSRRRFIYRGQTNYPVTLIGYGDQELLLRVEHDRARISDAAGRRLLGHVVTIMEGMAAASADTAVATLPILSAEERRGLAPPAAARLPTAGLCLHERFEAQVSRTPDATALVFEGASLTYAELNRKANRLAHRLRSMGVGPETLVGLCLERSLDLVVAVLGILKAGGAYLPLDPAYPKDRLAFMVKDARVSIIVTERSLGDSLPSGSAIHVLVDDPGEWSEGDFASGACAANLAYVIYTSGSTGKPKGCQITHGNVARLFDATDSWFGFGTAGCVDALPLLRLRLLGLGDLGRAALRWPAGGRPVLGEPIAGGVPRAAAPRAGDGAQPDAFGVPAAHPGRSRGRSRGGRAGPAVRDLRRRGARPAEPAAVVRASRRPSAAAREHVRHHGDDGPRDLPPADDGRRGSWRRERHRRADPRSPRAPARPAGPARPDRRAGRDVRRRRRRGARLPEPPGADGGALRARSVLRRARRRGSTAPATWPVAWKTETSSTSGASIIR